MKTLPENRTFHDYDLTRVFASQWAYVYCKSFEGATVSFEAFERRTVTPNASKPGALVQVTEAYERWPPDEAFGTWAWDCRTLEQAMNRAAIIEAKHQPATAVAA